MKNSEKKGSLTEPVVINSGNGVEPGEVLDLLVDVDVPMVTITKNELQGLKSTVNSFKMLTGTLQKKVEDLEKYPDFLEVVKSNIRSEGRFPSSVSGGLKVRRSIIPGDICERVPLHLDRSSYTETASLALLFRITPDEYIRQIIWTFNEMYVDRLARNKH